MFQIKRHTLALALFLALGILSTAAYAQAEEGMSYVQASGAQIKDIQIVGTERIEPSTVLTYLDIKAGDNMTQENLDSALKSLFATGLFADVTLRQRGTNTLEVTVLENPVINEIAFEGNDKLKDEDLQSEIQLRPRQVYTRTKVQSDTNRLYQIYRRNGRFSVSIEPKIIQLDQNRVNLVFEINEGAVTYVKSIKFVGNEHFSDGALREHISTAETRWYKFISNDDRYDPDRLSYDQELLRKFYLSSGYADFRVVSAAAELSKDKDFFYVTFTVEEGPRYKVGDIKISSDLRDFDEKTLIPELKLQPGDWYDADRVQVSIDNFTKALSDQNFDFVAVRPGVDRNREAKTINLSFNISETPKVFVERIDVGGNMRTMDKVIRREMRMVEGDPFSKDKLAKSEQKLKDLNFFEKVDVKTQQGSAPDKQVIAVDVQEKSTGEMSIGAGFSTADGPLADFSIKEHNFLGKGQDLGFATTIAGKRTEFNVAFSEPYFLDRDLAAGVNLFHTTRDLQDESSFDQKRTGGGLSIGYPLSEYWRQSIRYRLENNEISNVDPSASRYIRDQEGQRITSAVSQMLTYDTRDSKQFPTRGWYSWLNAEFAGLGGDAEYVSGKVGSAYFYPVYGDKVVLNVLGEGGAIGGLDGDVRINERYFIGGDTLRGFDSSGIGPRDVATGDALGGNLFYRGSVELAFPLGLPDELGIQGHAFTDFGSLWSLDTPSKIGIADEGSIRAAAGLGLSWRSPMGPIRIDVAQPYAKQDYDKKELFRFSFGTRF